MAFIINSKERETGLRHRDAEMPRPLVVRDGITDGALRYLESVAMIYEPTPTPQSFSPNTAEQPLTTFDHQVTPQHELQNAVSALQVQRYQEAAELAQSQYDQKSYRPAA